MDLLCTSIPRAHTKQNRRVSACTAGELHVVQLNTFNDDGPRSLRLPDASLLRTRICSSPASKRRLVGIYARLTACMFRLSSVMNKIGYAHRACWCCTERMHATNVVFPREVHRQSDRPNLNLCDSGSGARSRITDTVLRAYD